MRKANDYTPEQGWEWMLDGLLPRAAALVVEHDVARLEKQVRAAQLELAVARQVLKKIDGDEWPKDANGFLTYSTDNPLAR